MVKCEEIGRDSTEICAQVDEAEVYGGNLGFVAGYPSEGTWVLIREPVLEYRRVWKRSFEVDQLLSGVSGS